MPLLLVSDKTKPRMAWTALLATCTQPNPMYRLATVSPDGVRWILRRNCSVTPRQLGGIFVFLSGVSLAVALFFYSRGAWLVLPFTAAELVALAVAFLVFARHATDGEIISVHNGRLVVEVENAGRLQRVEFWGRGVQVDPQVVGDRLVAVHGGGQTAMVGRFLNPAWRPLLASELRQALRGG
jgi:uncharacterized membrane protein